MFGEHKRILMGSATPITGIFVPNTAAPHQ